MVLWVSGAPRAREGSSAGQRDRVGMAGASALPDKGVPLPGHCSCSPGSAPREGVALAEWWAGALARQACPLPLGLSASNHLEHPQLLC